MSDTRDREFKVGAPDKVRLTGITYDKTHNCELYLTVVIDHPPENIPSPFCRGFIRTMSPPNCQEIYFQHCAGSIGLAGRRPVPRLLMESDVYRAGPPDPCR